MPDIYIVVGGSGFLGRHIVEALKARGDEVSSFDVVQRYHDVPFYAGDISVPGAFASALEKSGATCIIHTASPTPGGKDQTIYARVNVEGTRQVIDAAVKANIKKLVYTSSAGVVFIGDDLENATEDLPYPEVPMDPYNATKALAEQMVLAASGHKGLLTVALRPASIYGPNDRQVLTGFVSAYKSEKTHFQIGENTNLFDFTYVDNLVQAHLLAADKLTPTSGVAGEAFFITNGDPVPFWDFPRMFWARLAAAGIKPVPVKKPFVMSKRLGMIVGFIMEYIAWFLGKEPLFTRFRVKFCCVKRWHNIDKARRLLGYNPLIGNEEGVERMANWWLEQHAKSA